MAALKGSRTEENLKAAFAGESQANRRYLYFANKADVEGQNDVAALFRSTAEGETGHAHGHLEWLEQCGDPATGLPIGGTRDNLKAAFAGESQANRRYLYFAAKADVEGHNDVSALFRSTAEGETGHAHGHLEYLESVGDPATNLPIGRTRENLKAAVAGETHEYTDMYPGMAKQARDEGFGEIADWFETLAKAERSHANRFQKALDGLSD
jgi:rubrerythrin